jgi:small RNA 2'-O-methyltransferase
VLAAIRESRARTILDLGCGDGSLLLRLAQEPGIARVVGIDVSSAALAHLQAKLLEMPAEFRERIELIHGSLSEPRPSLAGFDAAILVETIEHVDPDRLSRVERSVFHDMRPSTAVITTPNRDFNPLLGVPPHRYRHPDHRFEWGRAKFRAWVEGVARRGGYAAQCSDVAGAHPLLGGASQMAVFRRLQDCARSAA